MKRNLEDINEMLDRQFKFQVGGNYVIILRSVI